jgi:hypothetical protein
MNVHAQTHTHKHTQRGSAVDPLMSSCLTLKGRARQHLGASSVTPRQLVCDTVT